MAKKTFCDRCGVEVAEAPTVILTRGLAGDWQEDLCAGCAADLAVFMRGTTTSKHGLAKHNG